MNWTVVENETKSYDLVSFSTTVQFIVPPYLN